MRRYPMDESVRNYPPKGRWIVVDHICYSLNLISGHFLFILGQNEIPCLLMNN